LYKCVGVIPNFKKKAIIKNKIKKILIEEVWRNSADKEFIRLIKTHSVLPYKNNKYIITYTNKTELKKAVQNWKKSIFIKALELLDFLKLILDTLLFLYQVFDVKNLKKTNTEFTSRRKKKEKNVFVNNKITKNILKFIREKKKSNL
jgi:hypothetical protein